ncbi:MAG TPA: hypothetical protein VLQ80_16085, partial [Candidatus Saccharimonadia bacterium]|nr:hypothetical protein [Candidatus Saccharimonadia bacterium]
LWRVQLVRNTGFYKLYPLAHTLKSDPELPANLGDLPWSSEAEPMPGTFDIDAYRQAAFMRINNYPVRSLYFSNFSNFLCLLGPVA